jgi:hypothetical protein
MTWLRILVLRIKGLFGKAGAKANSTPNFGRTSKLSQKKTFTVA